MTPFRPVAGSSATGRRGEFQQCWERDRHREQRERDERGEPRDLQRKMSGMHGMTPMTATTVASLGRIPRDVNGRATRKKAPFGPIVSLDRTCEAVSKRWTVHWVPVTPASAARPFGVAPPKADVRVPRRDRWT
jgi:hypothetical protein